MGFNLEMFFDELIAVIESDDHDQADGFNELSKLIYEGRQYAKECGVIKDAD